MKIGRQKSQRQKQDRHSAEMLAHALPALFLKAEQLATTLSTGTHGRHKTGSGEDFWQFKPYTQGDSSTQIDWRQSAKREHIQIRQQEMETTESVWFWLDKNLSMSYQSHLSSVSKQESARILFLAVALLLNQGYEDYALLGSALKASHGTSYLNLFAEHLCQAQKTDFASDMAQSIIPSKSRIVIASDFLMPLETLKSNLKSTSRNGSRGILLHMADPAEATLPFKGRVQFTNLAGFEKLTIGQVENVRAEYQSLFQDHKTSIQQIASDMGWTYVYQQDHGKSALTLATLFGLLSGRAN